MRRHLQGRQAEILLVEHNPGDVRLAKEVLKEGKVCHGLQVVSDGVEAMRFLRKEGKYVDKPKPDLILLDLNLPKKDGREVLEEINANTSLSDLYVRLYGIRPDPIRY